MSFSTVLLGLGLLLAIGRAEVSRQGVSQSPYGPGLATVAANGTIAAAQKRHCCMRWTKWINADQNPSDGGDFESLGYNLDSEGGFPGRVTVYLARLGIQCNTPPKIQCRVARTQKPWYAALDYTGPKQRLNCDNERGLVCLDSDQADGHCHDYEIRLLCFVPCQCRVNWTPFFDRDNPSGVGDLELPGLVGTLSDVPCHHGCSPLDIECYTTCGVPAALSQDKGVTCDNNNGLQCLNSDQPKDILCQDYKVRYLCGDPS